MNSILSGTSSTTKETSRIAVKPLSYVFPTPSKITTGGSSAGVSDVNTPTPGEASERFAGCSVDIGTVGEESPLKGIEPAIDAVGQQADHDEDRNDVLGQPTSLAGHE